MTGQQQRVGRLPEADTRWTLFDQRRMCIYGGDFGSEHEAWQGRDKAALPSHIIPRPRSEVGREDQS